MTYKESFLFEVKAEAEKTKKLLKNSAGEIFRLETPRKIFFAFTAFVSRC